MTHSAFLRLLPPAYSDGISLPRGGLTSSSLPSARAVSVAVHQAHKETNHKESISQMIMQFGQGGAIIKGPLDYAPQTHQCESWNCWLAWHSCWKWITDSVDKQKTQVMNILTLDFMPSHIGSLWSSTGQCSPPEAELELLIVYLKIEKSLIQF